jgi:hypothetical protein
MRLHMPKSLMCREWSWPWRHGLRRIQRPTALERMGANQIEILPVVSRADVHKLEGIVTLRDILDAYGVTRA